MGAAPQLQYVYLSRAPEYDADPLAWEPEFTPYSTVRSYVSGVDTIYHVRCELGDQVLGAMMEGGVEFGGDGPDMFTSATYWRGCSISRSYC